jgi:hypothetical protein
MRERRPTKGKRSKFRPGDPVLLHARAIEVLELDGKTYITCSIRGWPVAGGRVYVTEDDAEPDPWPE